MAKLNKSDNSFFESVAALIQQSRTGVVKYVNNTIVITYYEIGRRIIEREQHGENRAQYGKKILQGLSDYLTAKLGKGWSVENLKLMRRFYSVYSKSRIGQPVVTQLEIQKRELPVLQLTSQIGQPIVTHLNPAISWKHYIHLMRITDTNERSFYEIEIAKNGWSYSEFERQFNTSLYERLALSRKKKRIHELAEKGQIIENPQDLLKDPYILEFTGLPEKAEYTETELEQKLIDHLQQFLLELGKGFTFVGRQVRFTYEEESFFVDLVFFNRLLRCFVLLDLKIGKLKHQDIGQMQMYVNFYDRKVKLPDENPTIGIVLCKDKKDTMVEMMLPEKNKRIFTAKYQTFLPSKDELRKLLEQN